MVILLLVIIAILLLGAARIKAAAGQLMLIGAAIFLGAFALEKLAMIPWWVWATGGALIFALIVFWVLKASKTTSPDEARFNQHIEQLAQRRTTPTPKVRKLDD